MVAKHVAMTLRHYFTSGWPNKKCSSYSPRDQVQRNLIDKYFSCGFSVFIGLPCVCRLWDIWQSLATLPLASFKDRFEKNSENASFPMQKMDESKKDNGTIRK
jgi:hypothetical protein